jgi:hypothetical protein
MSSFIKHLGMVAFALLPILSSAALQTGKVQVGKTSGAVTIIDANAQRKPLATGAVFQEGSLVETGINSTAELIFSNGASLVLTPNTLVQLRTFRQVPSAAIIDPYRQIDKDPSPSVTELEVPRGKIIGEVRKLNALSTFTVKTPAGLVRIRGTVFSIEYRVAANGMGKITVECVRGSVETTVYSSNAGPVSVDPGTQMSSNVASAALLSSIAQSASVEAGAPRPPAPSPAILATLAKPVQIIACPIPAEDLQSLAAILTANSTAPAEIAATIGAMAATAPSRDQIFPGGSDVPAKGFGSVITDRQPSDDVAKTGKKNAPNGPTTTSSGGSTSLDETLRKLGENVDRSVESQQVFSTNPGG